MRPRQLGAALGLIVLCACGGAPAPRAGSPSVAGCDRGDGLEADFRPLTPWTGPGVVDGALRPGSYTIATTRLQLLTTDESRAHFLAVMAGLGKAVDEAPGLVGYQIGNSERCAVTRTLTVWQSEDEMLEFVLGQAHSAAIDAIPKISRGGSNTARWQGSEADATWDLAARKIAMDQGPFY